jgi:hypothetical protein
LLPLPALLSAGQVTFTQRSSRILQAAKSTRQHSEHRRVAQCTLQRHQKFQGRPCACPGHNAAVARASLCGMT